MPVFEVAKTAVDQAARPGTGTPGEIVPVDEGHLEPAEHRLPGYAGTRGAAADDQEVVLLAR